MRWNDIIGHEKIKEFFKKVLISEQKPHAFLLAGPKSVGKTMLAKTFAKAILCSSGQDACGKCLSCKLFEQDAHPDYFFIEPEQKKDSQELKNSISIEQVRVLIKEAAFLSKMGKYRVVIINKAHLLTLPAANSLLKLLEEPPEGWIFLLLYQDGEFILPTIASRAVILKTLSLTDNQLHKYLVDNNIEVENEQIVCSLANGCIGQLLHYKEPHIQKLRLQSLEFLQKCSQGDYFFATTFTEKLEREDAMTICQYLTTFAKDGWQMLFCNDDNICNIDLKTDIKVLFKEFDVTYFKEFLENIDKTYFALSSSSNVRLAMEGLYILISNMYKKEADCDYCYRNTI